MYDTATNKTQKLKPQTDPIAPMKTLESTSLITLRPLLVTDLDDMLEWATDDEVTKHLLWDSYSSVSEAKNFLETVVANHPWFKAICVDEKVIGSITLDQRTGAHSCRAELGYVVARKYWGQGYCTAAVKEAVRLGFSDLNIQRIEALVDPDNITSQKVLEKCGFTKEGYLASYMIHKGKVRDRVVFGMVKELQSYEQLRKQNQG